MGGAPRRCVSWNRSRSRSNPEGPRDRRRVGVWQVDARAVGLGDPPERRPSRVRIVGGFWRGPVEPHPAEPPPSLGTDIAHVPQGAARSLSPSLRLDRHLRDVLHRLGVREVEAKLPELLERVGLDTVPDLWARYPHQLSGGQQQRFCLALALVARPTVLVLDEPTSSLDASTQSQVAKVIRDVADRNETAVLFVSHDLGLIASVADQISVMYAGEVVEAMPRSALAAPRHPYTRALLRSNPRVSDARLPVGLPVCHPAACCSTSARSTRVAHTPCRSVETAGRCHVCRGWSRGALLRVGDAASNLSIARTTGGKQRCQGLWWHAPSVGRPARGRFSGAGHDALDDVSLELGQSEIVGVVGESGSGKSTLLRVIAGLHAPDTGSVRYRGNLLDPRAQRRPRSLAATFSWSSRTPTAR